MLVCDHTQALTGGENDLESLSLAARQLALYGLASLQCRKGLLLDGGFLSANRDWPNQPG
jgi:hypothetical protein